MQAWRTLDTIYEDLARRADPVSLHTMKDRIVSCIPQTSDAVGRVDCMFKLACIVHHLKMHAFDNFRPSLQFQKRTCNRYLPEFFSKLQCEIKVVPVGSFDYKCVEKYWTNTCGNDQGCHRDFWKLKKVFSVRNELQEDSFKKLENRKVRLRCNLRIS